MSGKNEETDDDSTPGDVSTLSKSDPYKVLGEISDVDGIGVIGTSTATSKAGRGVEGFTDADGNNTDKKPAGVYGEARATNSEPDFTDDTYGVLGVTQSAGGNGINPAGVRGEAPGGRSARGVEGVTQGGQSDAAGVYGKANNTGNFAVSVGVYGETGGGGGGAAGVEGVATAGSGKTYGVRGKTQSDSSTAAGVYGETTNAGWAVHADGDAKVSGSLEVDNIGASVYRTSTQSIDDSYDRIEFDGVDRNDLSQWDTNNYQFDCAADGDYRVDTAVRFVSTPAEGTELELYVRLNLGGGVARTVDRVGWTNGNEYSIRLSKTLYGLSANDSIYVEALQGDGNSTYDIAGDDASTYLTITKVG